MASAEPGALKRLVDVERGIISREIFVSDEIYRQELEHPDSLQRTSGLCHGAGVYLFAAGSAIGREASSPAPGVGSGPRAIAATPSCPTMALFRSGRRAATDGARGGRAWPVQSREP